LNAKEVEIAVKTEADRVLKAITPTTDRLIVLDERGTHISSEEMADILLKASDDGCSCLVFAIGGPYGHGEVVREAAYQTVSLSKMVMNHQVANVLLLEQLYRAWTILKNEPYHH
jgi:23S rRNA (pseudouridine1915-N3)-methyltransferase